MDINDYTKLIVATALAATRLDGEMCCGFNQSFLERLQEFLTADQIEEFGKAYGKSVGVDYSGFAKICMQVFVNRKPIHCEIPDLHEVIEALKTVCIPVLRI